MDEHHFDNNRARWHLFQKLKDPVGPDDRMIYRENTLKFGLEIDFLPRRGPSEVDAFILIHIS